MNLSILQQFGFSHGKIAMHFETVLPFVRTEDPGTILSFIGNQHGNYFSLFIVFNQKFFFFALDLFQYLSEFFLGFIDFY